MNYGKWLAAGAGVALLGAVVQANAQSDCLCVVPASGQAMIGTIAAVDGEVMISGPGGFVPAQPAQQLAANTKLILGCEAAASIQLGDSCMLNIAPGSEVSLVPQDSNICVRSVERDAICGFDQQAESSTGPSAGVVVGLVGAGGVAAAIAAGSRSSSSVGSGDQPASR